MLSSPFVNFKQPPSCNQDKGSSSSQRLPRDRKSLTGELLFQPVLRLAAHMFCVITYAVLEGEGLTARINRLQPRRGHERSRISALAAAQAYALRICRTIFTSAGMIDISLRVQVLIS